LIQLPKKEAGAGLAFGGATTDALFGAGSGNALTKITKYATVIFFILALTVGFMQSNSHRSRLASLEGRVPTAGGPVAPSANTAPAPNTTAPAGATTPAPAPVPAGTNEIVLPPPGTTPDAPKQP
jgi:protein translocase SecG subunit